MAIQIDPEFKALIPPLSPEEYTQLEQNLIKESNPDSIVLFTWNGVLIDGHNRYEICQKHNISFKTTEKNGFIDRDDVEVWIIQNQFGRRNINNYQRSRLALALEGLFQKKAKEQHALKHTEQYKEDVKEQISAPLPEIETVKPIETTRQELAKIAKVSHDTIAKVKVIEQKAAPEVKKELETGTKSINEVYKEIRKEEKEAARKEEIAQLKFEIEQTPEPPDGKYDVIVVDPPWQMDGDYDPEHWRGVPAYPTLSIKEITDLDIPSNDNCILFFWVINKRVHDAYHIIDAWGFEIKNIFTWVKDKFGVGPWGRGQTEHFFICVKGKPLVDFSAQSTVIMGVRREHSRKPEEFYQMVDKTCNGRKLDYFSREKRDGWSQFGNDRGRF